MSSARAHTVIVGGGVMGASIAWHVARDRDPIEEPVVLLEKSALAAGSSGRSGAILRQHYSDRELASMARNSLRVYAGLEARTGRNIAFQRMGVITLAGPEKPETIALVEKNVAMQQSIGIDTRIVNAAKIRELVPGVDVSDGAIGAYEPDGAGVDPVRTVEAFAAPAREAGAITRIGVRATDLRVKSGRVVGVETSDGPIEAETVIVATGPWSQPLLARAGIKVSLRVVRPEQHFLALPRVGVTHGEVERERLEDLALERFGLDRNQLAPAAHPVILDLERNFYTRCEGHALRTRVGRMDYALDDVVPDPDKLDEHVTDEYKRWARHELVRRIPRYGDQPDVGSRVGMYTLSPDAQALIGRTKSLEGLIIVTGFSGHGFKLAPSVGEGVAQMLRGETVSAFDARFFSPDRFNARGEAAWSGAFGL